MALAIQALRVLCASGGCLEQGELQRRLPGWPSAEKLAAVLRDAQRFTLVRRPGQAGAGAAAEVAVVVATTPVRLCPENGAGCPGQCGRLHLCKYHLKGFCRNQLASSRKECRFVHNFYSDHNLRVLKQYGLENLNHDELCQLLLQNDPSLLPEVCLHYNKGDGLHGSCTFKTSCTKLHVCQYVLRGQCRFGSNCKRSHDLLNPECFEKLERQGMSSDIIEKLPSIYRNMYDIKNGKRNMNDIEDAKSSPCKDRKPSSRRNSSATNDDEPEQICLHHLYRSCGFKEKCIRTHFHLPYRWQVSDGKTWKDFKNMEEIEKAYCDPKNVRFDYAVTESGSFCVGFQDMCCGFAKVRRLSTASSVTKPPHFILTTEWIWYWKDEYDMWQEYGKQGDLHAAATVSSDDLEKAYLAKSSPKLTFKAGRHEYELNFESMMQKNLHYRTERMICRRPKFVSQTEVENTRARGFKHSEGFKSIPAHWDKSALPELGFKLIELDCSSEEYKKVKVDFQRTMPRAAIKRICRVQNPSLWELYQWQKDLMQKTNGGKAADERFLFHGTNKKDIDAICQQNFDWRICGLHGTVYGKGSYFARDASYSDNYCGTDSHTKTMFLARVLVGEFTVGSSDYVRPPMKDSQNFYDSCVNNSSNPSIFVIFEKQQIYPEYLIEYQASARYL
ncbi:protein mono-ADP-ribosyltransferase PARP12-like isoform X1 [Corvus cornix cornix]|uniref:protein mono-ADP-ribosyltransferase PARP12-like isoform X1 n=1 Tax=Corvus cornix cornix TaxID=932674 RepID=UPI00194E4E36|nr:protein mono-ADP-ribosyltransferase PARP12-like isoform X1 [Corvus cornix cornix]